jgi:hypothetical protein
MNWVVRLSAIVGLVCGGWGMASVVVTVSTVINPISIALSAPYAFFYFLYLIALVLLTPLIAFVGSIFLLVRPMTLERRGVIGFVTFVFSLLSIIIVLFFIALSMI